MTKMQKDLHLTGWFRHFFGPVGAVPVQFFAILHSGEYVYFRARGRTAELTISNHPSDAAPIRRYERYVRIDEPMRAGVMSSEQCVEMIKHWFGKYFAQLEHQTRKELRRGPRRDRRMDKPRNREYVLARCA